MGLWKFSQAPDVFLKQLGCGHPLPMKALTAYLGDYVGC